MDDVMCEGCGKQRYHKSFSWAGANLEGDGFCDACHAKDIRAGQRARARLKAQEVLVRRLHSAEGKKLWLVSVGEDAYAERVQKIIENLEARIDT